MPGVSALDCERALDHRLVTTVYQATRNSSELTKSAARTVAEAIGARHLELDVDGLVQSNTST